MAGVYKEIEPLTKIFDDFIARRVGDRIPCDVRRRIARFLANVFVVAAYYGAGDALAGNILMHSVGILDKLVDILKWLGATGIPEHLPRSTAGFLMLLNVRFNDEKVDRALEELRMFANSGGGYTPKLDELVS